MKIITTPDERLREKSEKVRKINEEIRGIIADTRKLSLDWEKEHPYELSAAMAAPQMGILKRIIIIRDDMEDKKNLIIEDLESISGGIGDNWSKEDREHLNYLFAEYNRRRENHQNGGSFEEMDRAYDMLSHFIAEMNEKYGG